MEEEMKGFLRLILFSALLLQGCNTSHKKEFYSISRYDVIGLEEFIKKYPSSPYVDDAEERIKVAKEDAEREKQRQLVQRYGDVSLSNGSAPYAEWFGANDYFDEYTEHSEIIVNAPDNSDVVVIVRYDNANGRVAGHKYVRAGMTSTVYLENDRTYQVFFYMGNGWYSDKSMPNGIYGGFVKDECAQKDKDAYQLSNETITYTLSNIINGNFSPAESQLGELF